MSKYVDLEVPGSPCKQEQWHKYSFRWMLTMLGLIISSSPHFNFPSYAQKLWLVMESKRRILLPWQQKHFSPSKIVCQRSVGKKMLTALAEKIKFKYKFLLFYQGLFVFFSVFLCFNVQRFVKTDLLAKIFFLAFSGLPNMQNPAFKKSQTEWWGFTSDLKWYSK